MKMTIEKFDELVKADKAKRDALSAEINDLLRQESELDAAAQDAASAGDVDGYMKKLDDKNKVSVALFVKRKCLDNLPKPDMKTEAKEAWSDYSGDYNKKMRKAVADFKAAKAKLLQQYSNMVDLQQEALATRRRISKIAEADEINFPMEYIPVRKGATEKGLLKLGGFACGDPDSCYYLSDYCERNNTNIIRVDGVTPRDREEARISSIVVMHNPQPFCN